MTDPARQLRETKVEMIKKVIMIIVTTPVLWPPLILLGIVIVVFVGEIIIGVGWLQYKHVEFCTEIATRATIFNATYTIPDACRGVIP